MGTEKDSGQEAQQLPTVIRGHVTGGDLIGHLSV